MQTLLPKAFISIDSFRIQAFSVMESTHCKVTVLQAANKHLIESEPDSSKNVHDQDEVLHPCL